MQTDTDPLALRAGESKRANIALRDYADMGAGRSIRALAERYRQQAASGAQAKPSTARLPTLWGWSKRFEWQLRVAAWTADLQQLARLAQIDAVREMNMRQAELGRSLQNKGVERLASLDAEELSMRDALASIMEGAKLERLARGEASDRVDVFARVRELARELGYTDEETRQAVAAAQQIVRGET